MYKHIFFDLDHTLLDFAAGEHIAVRQVIESEGLAMTAERFQQYQSINKKLWQALERGEIKKDEVLTRRFSEFFQLQAITVDGVLKEQIFRTAINNSHQLLPGAVDILAYLKDKPVILSSATNGVYATQMKRMKEAGIYSYFSHHFISEEIGYAKPQPEFFAYALKQVNARPEEVLMIGDSITSDIAGAQAAGIDSCYIGPEATDATYSIGHLMELTDIIK